MGAAGSTTKFGDGKFGQRDATERGDASAIQQLAIYAESPLSRVDFTEEKTAGKTVERGRDSSRLDVPGEIHRAERIGHGAIEFAARDDDSDVAAYYRCYTSPRHCYRLPPARTCQQPALLLGAYGPNRNISVPTRAIAAYAARNSKPPIREPNMPEKRERQDEKEKRDKKEKKEPVIRTERESAADSSESRAAMAAGDNPTGDPDASFRYEWGVKLAEEEPAKPSDNDNLAEKGRRYVTKRLWGVNLTQPQPDVEGAAPPTSESPGRGAYEHRNASRVLESADIATEAGETKVVQISSKPRRRASANESGDSSLRAKNYEYLSTSPGCDSSPAGGDFLTSQQDTTDVSLLPSSQALRKMMKTMPGASRKTTALDDDHNASEEAASDAEISAWQRLALKSKPAMQAILSATRPENIEGVSIRPEAPQPKLDVRVVRSVEDISEDSKEEQSAGYKLNSMGFKRVAPADMSNLDNYSSSKKLHTASARIHHALRDSNDIARRRIGSLPVNSASADGITRTKSSMITSAYSTNSEDSKEEDLSGDRQQDGRPFDLISNQQDGQQADSNSLNDEKLSSLDTNNSLESTERFRSIAEIQTASTSDQKQPDAEIDFTETPNTIADEQIEISTGQLREADRETADHASTSAREDESRIEDESVRGETERRSFEDSYVSYDHADSYDEDKDASYVGYHGATTDSDPARSREAESTEEAADSMFASAKNIVPNPDTGNPSDDDFGRQYVTDGDYVRVYGDPYPYSKEHLDKWRMPVSKSLFYKPIKRETLLSGPPSAESTPRNANDAYADGADGQSYGSHAVGAVMETSGSGGGGGDDGAMGAKNVRLGFRVSSRDQRVAAPDCDAADALGLRGWTEASSRLDRAAGATASGKTSEAERGDNASLSAYHQ